MNSKYRIFIKSQKNLEDEMHQDKRRSNAVYLISTLNQGSTWLRIENIRLLHFYLDFDFVKDALMKMYKETNDDEIKEAILKLKNGTLDVSDLVAERKRYQDRKEYINQLQNEIDKQMESELEELYEDEETTLNYLKLKKKSDFYSKKN